MSVKVRLVKDRWTVKVDFHQHRKSKSFTSEDKARDFAQRLKTALELYGFGALDLFTRQQQTQPKAPTLKEFAERWLEEIESSDRALNTRINYRIMLRKHVLPSLGDLRIDTIRYPDLKAFAIAKSASYSRDSVRLMFAALRAVCSEAVREGILERNPVLGADLSQFISRRRSKQQKRADPFTLEELRLLEAKARESFPRYWPFICCLARSGIRISEAIALEWRHIDFRGRYLVIDQNLPQHRQLGAPKSDSGYRKVEMSDELAGVLKKLKVERKREWLEKGQPQIPSWVFCTGKGTPVHYKNFLDRVWRRLIEKNSVRPRTPHDLRHSFATLHLMGGASVVWVKEQLGHSSIQVTVDFYKHWLPAADRGGVSRLDTQQTRKQEEEADEIEGQESGN